MFAVRMLLTTIAGVLLLAMRSRWPAFMERHEHTAMACLFFVWGWRVKLHGDVAEVLSICAVPARWMVRVPRLAPYANAAPVPTGQCSPIAPEEDDKNRKVGG